jgi:Spy/CpxP family protein refolding chaperone
MQTFDFRTMAMLVLLIPAWNAFAAAEQTADPDGSHIHCIYHGKHEQNVAKPDFLAEFDLADAQKQDIAALMQLYQPRLQEISNRGEARRRELLATAPDDPSYSVLSDDVAAEAASSAREVVVLLTELQTNVYNLLNSDQRARYNEQRDTMLARLESYAQQREATRQSGESGQPFGFGDMQGGTLERGEPHACVEHTHPDAPTATTSAE